NTVNREGSFLMDRNKIPADVRLHYAKLCFEEKMSRAEVAETLGIDVSAVKWWIYQYQEQGEKPFKEYERNAIYPEELKLNAVLSYLNGEGSYKLIAARYGLRNVIQLKTWVKMYNEGKDFLNKMSGGSRMTTSRKTTKEERIKIVKECLESGCNYGEIAIKYNVSYQQVYGWVKRFKELGEAGLEDRRGRRKADQEPRSEIEKLQIENERLKHGLYMMKMERDLLKKVKELERKDLYRK
ncbi:MAG: transposase, partial [Mogibacterium sp.]|nr:transposase [Mogibacterium sp.]